MVEIMETGVVAREGRHILGPRSKDEQRTVGAGLEAAALGFPVLADGVSLHMYQAQALLQCHLLYPLLTLGDTGLDQYVRNIRKRYQGETDS